MSILSFSLYSQIEKEDFEVFRKRFYSDSSFHMSRIVFPLEGDCNFCYNEIDILNQKDTNTVYFFIKDHILYWKKDTWEFISEFKDKEFQSEEGMYRTSTTGDDKKKIERIKNMDVYYNDGYYLEYKLIDNKWFLTNLHVYSY
ncbi:MAG TPA: hypothetical protein DD434_12930 [Bacteroidales bacterium]|nr:hypothetical protein [Bacteroidales bacterium]